ncbi:hypothetical protein NPIL_127711 [Nephila pilipes]|uniref:Uncharacterized protein n=1 Tax=Nephila pilipes TaxID=299642 RepID=A0A8X6PJ35_NEPPI|nr:hypothetical protein NPIL_127711 [Nephila pilipes]
MRPCKFMLYVGWTGHLIVHNELYHRGKRSCHHLYSPDLAPSDYHHLFHSLDNHFRGNFFTNKAEFRQVFTYFFATKPPEFYHKKIAQLETRWQKVPTNATLTPIAITLRTNNGLHFL